MIIFAREVAPALLRRIIRSVQFTLGCLPICSSLIIQACSSQEPGAVFYFLRRDFDSTVGNLGRSVFVNKDSGLWVGLCQLGLSTWFPVLRGTDEVGDNDDAIQSAALLYAARHHSAEIGDNKRGTCSNCWCFGTEPGSKRSFNCDCRPPFVASGSPGIEGSLAVAVWAAGGEGTGAVLALEVLGTSD